MCPGVDGPEPGLAKRWRGLRAAGWDAPPVRVEIDKRIPVAAGMGGGSADAAAMLRYAPRAGAGGGRRQCAGSPRGSAPTSPASSIRVRASAPAPGEIVAAGGRLEAITPCSSSRSRSGCPPPRSTARPTGSGCRARRAELTAPASRARGRGAWSLRGHAGSALPARLIVNDLQPARAVTAPRDRRRADAAREAGADQALVCGSGPTVIGLFWGADGLTSAPPAPPRAAAGASAGDAPRSRRQRGAGIGGEPVSRFPQFAPLLSAASPAIAGFRHNSGVRQ